MAAGQTPNPLKKVRAAKAAAEKVFSDLLGDVAIGITRIDGAYGLKVNVVAAPSGSIKMPSAVEGVPVQVEVTGVVKKRIGKAK